MAAVVTCKQLSVTHHKQDTRNITWKCNQLVLQEHYHNKPTRIGIGQVCHQRLSSAFDLLLIFLCSLVSTLISPNSKPLTMHCWQIWTSQLASLAH